MHENLSTPANKPPSSALACIFYFGLKSDANASSTAREQTAEEKDLLNRSIKHEGRRGQVRIKVCRVSGDLKGLRVINGRSGIAKF
ncbi:hypothetical protein CDL15_Pgr005137 [Punica granatum]|uniref:Uncharacterized protein n=1 Tax=Punica granatum TaxID=22663 RepID=A0A218WQ09_PUNGR|nr:hypothetical protein CDL15_Pgr005137 [Punica granatum]